MATLSASRVSYEPVRRMHVWAPQAFAAIDFAARSCTLVRPSETLLRRQFDVRTLSPEQIEHYREHLAEEHLPRQVEQFDAVDALALEVEDFIEAVRTPRSPRVSGEAGRDALAVAEEILDCIRDHAWDDRTAGPMRTARPGVIPAPHFQIGSAQPPVIRREAG